MLRLFKAVSKGTVNHILASEKNLDCQHEMEYHVIRLVVILHDCPVGKRVRSEQANEASALRTLVCLSFRSLSFPSRPGFMTVKELFTVNHGSKYKRFYSNSLLGLW